MSDERKPQDIARKFQRDMQKMGLGITFDVSGRGPVKATTYCPKCSHVAIGEVVTCPECGEEIEEQP